MRDPVSKNEVETDLGRYLLWISGLQESSAYRHIGIYPYEHVRTPYTYERVEFCLLGVRYSSHACQSTDLEETTLETKQYHHRVSFYTMYIMTQQPVSDSAGFFKLLILDDRISGHGLGRTEISS